ncbi:MAG: YbaB/EbfC family nucleoid-associated protein [Saccharothrix sp.]|nr:YbaB/EbfC family nucleoid-associated protein [Saccharothrix sp.]
MTVRPDLGDLEGLAEGIRAFRDRLATVRATAHSRDGLVTATTSGRGELLDLVIDPRVYRHPDSVGLAESVTDAVHRATEQAQREAFALARPFLPPDARPAETDVDFDPALHQFDGLSGAG